MDLLQRSLRNNGLFSQKKIKSDLDLIFSDVLRTDDQNKKRKLRLLKINLLRTLDKKPVVKFKTKKIFEEFENFLNNFEK